MLNTIRLSSLRNGEFIQFFTEVLTIVQQHDPALLQVTEQFVKLSALVAEAEALLHIRRGHVLSDRLAQLDLRRENALTGMQRLIEGLRLSTQEPQMEAAILLQTHLAGFGGNIARDNYQSQTTMVRRLVSDLNGTAELSDAIATLGLQNWVNELETANSLFATNYLARARDTGSASPESVRLKRSEIVQAWYRLRDRLNAYFVIEAGAPPFGETIRFINGLGEYYASLIARRTNRTEPVPDNEEATVLPDT